MDEIIHRGGHKAAEHRGTLLHWINLSSQQTKLLGCTRSELAGYTGLRINVVCVRIDELIKQGKIKKGGMRKCTVMGTNVQYLVVVTDAVPTE